MKDEKPPDVEDEKYKNKEFLYKYDLSMYQKIKTAVDKRFTFDNLGIEQGAFCDTYEELSKNKALNILIGSDGLNAQVIKDEYDKQQDKIKNNKKPSFVAKWSDKIIGKMGMFGDKMLQRGQTYMTDMSEQKEKETGESLGSAFTQNMKNAYGSIVNDQNKELLKNTRDNREVPFVRDIGRMIKNLWDLKK
jgi:hypothetical protein